MDGLSRWDLVLWIVAAYAAVTGVLVAIHGRHAVMDRFRSALRHINRGFLGAGSARNPKNNFTGGNRGNREDRGI